MDQEPFSFLFFIFLEIKCNFYLKTFYFNKKIYFYLSSEFVILFSYDRTVISILMLYIIQFFSTYKIKPKAKVRGEGRIEK